MAPMIEKPSQISHETFFEDFLPHSASKIPPDYCESSLSDAKGAAQSKYGERFKNFCFKAWKWIKHYFLCWCFDDENDKLTSQINKMEEFVSLYYHNGEKNTPQPIIDAYQRLSKSLKDRIKNECMQDLKKIYSNQDKNELEQTYRKILENPLTQHEGAFILGNAIVRIGPKLFEEKF